jgi:hypothetical protein
MTLGNALYDDEVLRCDVLIEVNTGVHLSHYWTATQRVVVRAVGS